VSSTRNADETVVDMDIGTGGDARRRAGGRGAALHRPDRGNAALILDSEGRRGRAAHKRAVTDPDDHGIEDMARATCCLPPPRHHRACSRASKFKKDVIRDEPLVMRFGHGTVAYIKP